MQYAPAAAETRGMAARDVIAIVFDFDDTLVPDSTSQLLEGLGVDVDAFWRETVATLVRDGWDPALAYLHRLLSLREDGLASGSLTRQRLFEAGEALQLYPGVETLFARLRAAARELNAHSELEFYVVSSGLQTVIEASPIRPHLKQVWACEFHYEPETGRLLCPRNVVSFTDKTRYLFQIHKGLLSPRSAGDPFEVNRRVERKNIHVPFERMVFVGDGYTDVPCFSLVTERGGKALAVVDPKRRERWGRAWGFLEEGRALNLSPTDYSEGSSTEMVLMMAIQRIIEESREK